MAHEQFREGKRTEPTPLVSAMMQSAYPADMYLAKLVGSAEI